MAADVRNAYINAKTREKVYFIAGDEFVYHKVQKVVIIRVLYGLKSSAASWRDHRFSTFQDMEFSSTVSNPDV